MHYGKPSHPSLKDWTSPMENDEDKVETSHRGEVILQQPEHCASFEFSTAWLHTIHHPT